VQVRYMPKDPKTAALSDAMDMPLFPAFLLFGGTICALAGVTAWRQQRKLNNSKT
jgi:hypothetical protein